MNRQKHIDVLSNDTLCHAMGALSARFPVYVHPSLDSTNAEAKRLAANGVRHAVVVAEAQTQGRGRMGRSFYSPDGTGVYFSILYTFSEPIANAVTVTTACATAVMRAIRRVCKKQTAIKWVNDLYLDGKKVCGILAESVLDPSRPTEYPIIIGIGINLRDGDFPPELAEIAGALCSDASRADLITAVLEELLPYLDCPADRSWLGDYKNCSCVLGKPIVWHQNGDTHQGIAVDVDENGALIAEDSQGARVVLFSGEISVRTKQS